MEKCTLALFPAQARDYTPFLNRCAERFTQQAFVFGAEQMYPFPSVKLCNDWVCGAVYTAKVWSGANVPLSL